MSTLPYSSWLFKAPGLAKYHLQRRQPNHSGGLSLAGPFDSLQMVRHKEGQRVEDGLYVPPVVPYELKPWRPQLHGNEHVTHHRTEKY
jgi:hypothetical protein